MKDYMSALQSAEYLGVSQARINQLAQSGRIKRYEVAGYYVYKRADLDRYRDAPKSIGGRPLGARNKPKPVKPDLAERVADLFR